MLVDEKAGGFVGLYVGWSISRLAYWSSDIRVSRGQSGLKS